MSYPFTCGHCGSEDVFRRTDGDLECNDCPGITTTGTPTAEDARDALQHLRDELHSVEERERHALDILGTFIDQHAEEVPSEGDRHVASIVFTHALPADTDRITQTLAESEYIRVEPVNAHYADIIITDGDQND